MLFDIQTSRNIRYVYELPHQVDSNVVDTADLALETLSIDNSRRNSQEQRQNQLLVCKKKIVAFFRD